jgi:hypothetical protein
MSWVRAIRETLEMVAKVTDPVWQAEFAAQVDGLQKAADQLTAIYAEELAERNAKLKMHKPAKAKPTSAVPKSPDADTVGTVKNIRPRRPFVHSVPPAGLPGGHR